MTYNPQKHHRQSIRLQGYDYAQAGLYFITICCENRAYLFGNIKNNELILNQAGKIADECWLAIPKHFPNAIIHEYIIMPNHIHGIIELTTGSIGAENFLPKPPERPQTDQTDQPIGAENFLPQRPQRPQTDQTGPTKRISKNDTTFYRFYSKGI